MPGVSAAVRVTSAAFQPRAKPGQLLLQGADHALGRGGRQPLTDQRRRPPRRKRLHPQRRPRPVRAAQDGRRLDAAASLAASGVTFASANVVPMATGVSCNSV